MVQPYIPSVDVVGETALVYLDRRFSHAIAKSAVLERGVVNEAHPGIRPNEPSEAQLALGERALATVTAEPLLYARVDLMEGEAGPVVSEIELTEPYLFLRYAQGAVARFVDAICAELGRPA